MHGSRLRYRTCACACRLLQTCLHACAQVLDVVGESVALFDEVNVATALHRLAKLQPPGTSGPQSPIVYADQFQALVEAVQRLLDRFEAQAISNTLWGAPRALHLSPFLLVSQCIRAVSGGGAVGCAAQAVSVGVQCIGRLGCRGACGPQCTV